MFAGTASKVIEALQPYKLKATATNEYRGNSPFRSGSNSQGFCLTIHDDEHGAFIDHVSEEQGSLYELAARLGIALPEKISVATTKRAYTGIEDYAKAHGIPSDALTTAGWREVDYQGRPALEFQTLNGRRWRFLDGSTPHYKSERGYERCWYGLKAATMSKVLQGQPLIICNGEISVVTAHQYDLPACAITGGEKQAIPLPLFDQLMEFLDDGCEPQVIIAMDCDPAGIKAAKGIQSQLIEAGYPPDMVRAVDMGLGKGGDLSDFCILHQQNSLAALHKLPDLEAVPEVSGFYSWEIIHSDELENLPRVEWVIPGEVQAMGLNVVFGASGVGKSFWALDKALQISQTSNVVYMAGEGVYGYNKRIQAWESHYKKKRGKLYICTGAVSLLDKEEFAAFLDSLKHLKPSVVVVDTLARSMVGGDENNARDMGLFIHACDTIKHTLGCAVILVHHTGKDRHSERGSSALRGAADVMVKISDEGDIIIVEMDKVKDDNPLPLRYYKLLPVKLDDDMGSSVVFVPSEQVVQTEDDLFSGNQQKIMRLLADVYIDGASSHEISAEAHIPHASVRRDIGKMKDLGFVEQSGYGQPYLITESGNAALSRTLQTGIMSTDQSDQSDQPDHDPIDQSNDDHIDHIDQLINFPQMPKKSDALINGYSQ